MENLNKLGDSRDIGEWQERPCNRIVTKKSGILDKYSVLDLLRF